MQFLRVPAPFPSTIISLAPEEQFTYRRHTIQSVTVDPLAPTAPYTLSGLSKLRRNHQAFSLSALPPQAPELLRSAAESELQPPAAVRPQHPDAQAVQTPTRLRSVPPQRQHLADPQGPAPEPGQTVRPPRTASALPAPRQHLAAATPPPTLPTLPGGRHRA